MDANPFCGLIRQTGDDRDAVVPGGVQITPVRPLDGSHIADRISPGPAGGLALDRIAHLEILDGADAVAGAAVVPAQSDISIPCAGAGEMAHALVHGGGVRPLVSFIADSQAGETRTLTLAPAVVKLFRLQKLEQNRKRLKAGKSWTEKDLVFSNEVEGIPLSPYNLSLLQRACERNRNAVYSVS